MITYEYNMFSINVIYSNLSNLHNNNLTNYH